MRRTFGRIPVFKSQLGLQPRNHVKKTTYAAKLSCAAATDKATARIDNAE